MMRSSYFNPQGLAGILCSRAEVYTHLGRGDEALADLDRTWGMVGEVRNLTLRRQLQFACLRTKCGVYSLHGKYPQLREAAEQALEVSLVLRDRKGEGVSLQALGNVHYSLGEYGEAREYYHRSLMIHHEIGDRRGETGSLGNIGLVHFCLGEFEQARSYHQRSLAINQEIGDRWGEANCLNNIGIVHSKLGEYERARDTHRRALKIRQEIGDQRGKAESLTNIGLVHDRLGEYEEAGEYYRQSLTINQEIGDRWGEAISLSNIGTLHLNLGEYEQALDHHHRSLAIDQENGDRQGEAYDQTNIGNVLLEMGDFPGSERAYQKGEVLTKVIGARELGGDILAGLAALYLDQDRLRLAEEKIHQMGDLAGALNSKKHQGVVHYLQGRLHVKRGEGDLARTAFQESIAIFKENKNELELGKACYYFARGLRKLDDEREEEWYRVQAKEIFARLGAKGWLRKVEEGNDQSGERA